MLRIETLESSSGITLELHGRLAGPWVPLLESVWRGSDSTCEKRMVSVDLKGVTGIDGAGRYLLCLMEAKNVKLTGGGIAIRGSLQDRQEPDSTSP
jgi:ABC-type transporter Mla MlaB component